MNAYDRLYRVYCIVRTSPSFKRDSAANLYRFALKCRSGNIHTFAAVSVCLRTVKWSVDYPKSEVSFRASRKKTNCHHPDSAPQPPDAWVFLRLRGTIVGFSRRINVSWLLQIAIDRGTEVHCFCCVCSLEWSGQFQFSRPQRTQATIQACHEGGVSTVCVCVCDWWAHWLLRFNCVKYSVLRISTEWNWIYSFISERCNLWT